MAKKTITAVYHIMRVGASPSNEGPDVAGSLEGQLDGIVFYATRNEMHLSSINHFAHYVREAGDSLRDAVYITNVDFMTEEIIPEIVSNTIRNALCDQLDHYETGAGEKVLRVCKIISTDPKLSDHQLMQMNGLLQKTTI